MRVLVIFSNPAEGQRVRLDLEDKVFVELGREFGERVSIERQHASDIDDVHMLLSSNHYDIIQFSGHGSPAGIYLDRSDQSSGDLVNAGRMASLLDLAEPPPRLVLFLCCYSDSASDILAASAPFVVTSKAEVLNSECLVFVRGFYESLFNGTSIQSAFNHALYLLHAKGHSSESFRLNRRCLIRSAGGLYVESKPLPHRDTILINLDAVRDGLGSFGLSEEELCHLLARKITIHHRIFDQPRESATIPIGRLLFGEFEWSNARDVVHCRRLMRLRADTPLAHWEAWARVLISYNDLASCAYRGAREPADPGGAQVLARAVSLFAGHVSRYLLPMKSQISALGFESLLPHVSFAAIHVDDAKAKLEEGRYVEVVESLELALTNYHEVATGLQPPEELKD